MTIDIQVIFNIGVSHSAQIGCRCRWLHHDLKKKVVFRWTVWKRHRCVMREAEVKKQSSPGTLHCIMTEMPFPPNWITPSLVTTNSVPYLIACIYATFSLVIWCDTKTCKVSWILHVNRYIFLYKGSLPSWWHFPIPHLLNKNKAVFGDGTPSRTLGTR